MKRRTGNASSIFCLAFVLLSGFTAGAQSAGQKSDAGVVATMTVTGCLERWAPDPAAGADPAAKPPAGVQFMLTHIEGQAASVTSGDGKPQPAARHERYLLLPAKNLNYAAHLSHRVRITGTIAPQPSTGASPAQQLADPASRETNLPARPEAESYDGNLVEVATLSMVAPACER